MIAQFVEAPDVMQATLKVPQAIIDQCATDACSKQRHWGKATWSQIAGDVDISSTSDTVEDVEGGEGRVAIQEIHVYSWWDNCVAFLKSLFRF